LGGLDFGALSGGRGHGFLRFLEKELRARPADIVPADRRQLKRIGKLVAGVKAG